MATVKKGSSLVGYFRERSNKCKIYSAFILAGILIVVGLIAFGISKAVRHPTNVSVIVPLYIYPNEGAWDPLYNALDSYPSLQFIVIVNPDDGSGNNTLLDPNFQRELPRLLGRKNVATVGYVRTIYATRNKTAVFEDVDNYAGWNIENSTTNYTLHGIFFDETPSNYSIESARYMAEVDSYVKNHNGFAGNYIIHNPGTLPDDDRIYDGADLIVVFESGFSDYTSDPVLQSALHHLAGQDIDAKGRQNFAYMFNGMPSNWTSDQMSGFIKSVKDGAQWLFMTDTDLSKNQNIYGKFGNDWDTFIKGMESN